MNYLDPLSFFSRIFASIMIVILTIACQPTNSDKQEVRDGEKLAKKYCQNCHDAVEPGLLTKDVWVDFVLPAMSKHFGLELWSKNSYQQTPKSTITYVDWMKMVKYYESAAPDSLTYTQPTKLKQGWSVFALRKPVEDSSRIATTVMVAINSSDRLIYTCDGDSADLFKWDDNFKLVGNSRLPSPATHILFNQGLDHVDILTCIGGMKASDQTRGEVLAMDREKNIRLHPSPVMSGLIRPIHTIQTDYNKDGLTDYVVSAFGHTQGGLYLLKHLADHSFQKIPIREVPGATQSITEDYNADGWPDIMTLFAHGDEGIWLFLNDRKGGFSAKNILRFPPVYGSNSFQLVDMNRDGKLDIVYAAGDNSDYSKILKPYHGVYIFTNLGDFNFKQSYFFPINGCTKATASDFDLDGDMDIATIAFFADLKNKPAEKFIYLEHQNGTTGKFEPISIPVQQYGRWICMDVNDWDADGDLDIVLGNYSKGLINQENVKPTWNTHLPFIVLENKTILTKNR
ncbi:FG-GAP repeat domain-containing protein [Dyadobacter arcticus]|uniref:Repeat domain-containing protein n=1 Tax=Dyadobacter arcticus TaxID=1078754 RepID=A0ABX0UIN7_9BACT|nr:VCBS repeat-containing protein [Dyadobacter arcticus]NIJ51909.1 hypothetical protein [Dyadobacter arcticus]